ncbi:PorV/PorQ family protein [bacterium]|nr:PorV/PorQ family protein [bacterium]
MLRKNLTILIVLLVAVGSFSSAEAGVAEATGIFLLISPGARPGGMGEAFVAIADDATTTWWNPAGLAFLERRELTLMHTNWLPEFNLPDLYYDFISYTNFVEDWGTFGFNVVFINLGSSPHTDDLGRTLGHFSTYETALTASYGATVTENFGLGLNVKFIYSHLSDVGAGQEKGSGVATNFAVDLGVLYKMTEPLLHKQVSFGANLANMGPKMSYIDQAQADPIPTNLKFGLAYKLLDDEFNKFTIAYDMNKLLVRKHSDNKTDPFYIALFTAWTDEPVFIDMIYNLGFEYWYSDMVALRWGYWNDQLGDLKPMTYGASFKVSAYRFDFSYIYGESTQKNTMRLSLNLTL